MEFLQALSCLTAVAFTDLSIAVREFNNNLAAWQRGHDAYVQFQHISKESVCVCLTRETVRPPELGGRHEVKLLIYAAFT